MVASWAFRTQFNEGLFALYSDDVGHLADGTIKELLGELVNVWWWLSLTPAISVVPLKVAPMRENPVRRGRALAGFSQLSTSSPVGPLGVAHA